MNISSFNICRIVMAAFALLAVTALYACATSEELRAPDAGELVLKGKSMSDQDVSRLDKGRSLYMKECNECHWRKWPDERKPDEWKKILKRHRGRIPLDDASFGELADYVLRVSYCFETRKCGTAPEASH